MTTNADMVALRASILDAQQATAKARISTEKLDFLVEVSPLTKSNSAELGIALDKMALSLKMATDCILRDVSAEKELLKSIQLKDAALRAALDWLSNAPISYANGVERYGVDEGLLAGNAGHRMLLKQIMFALGIEEVSLEDWNKSHGKTE